VSLNQQPLTNISGLVAELGAIGQREVQLCRWIDLEYSSWRAKVLEADAGASTADELSRRRGEPDSQI
jgi:hypothetical protein